MKSQSKLESRMAELEATIAALTAAHAKALEDGKQLSERLAMAHEYIRGEWRLNRLHGPMGNKLINSLNSPVSSEAAALVGLAPSVSEKQGTQS